MADFLSALKPSSESLPSVHGLRYFQACARSFGNSTECINAL